ncbi:glycosyltransferase [Spirosoma pulveris]
MLAEPHPFVSIVICFLNEERFLAEAITSVIQQTYIHWELILVDDGSQDESTQIARTYSLEFPDKIQYCAHANQANKGLSASRNAGIRKATGNLIAFLDADDVWLPEKLAAQVAIHQQYPGAGLIAEASIQWSSWLTPPGKDQLTPIGTDADRLYPPPQLAYQLYPLGKGAAPGPCAWLLTREAIRRAGGFEESFTGMYQLYEDQAFLSKIYLREAIYISSSCHNLYRQRPDSIVKTVIRQGNYAQVRRFFLEWYYAYLKANGVADKKLLRLVRRNLMPYHQPVAYFLSHTLTHELTHRAKQLMPAVAKRLIRRTFNLTR